MSPQQIPTSRLRMASRLVLPLLLGVGVTFWLFHDDWNKYHLGDFVMTPRMWQGFALAWLFMAGRDFGLTWRFHTIARPHLSWWRALRVDFMCAFTSAVTPSAMGGSAFAIFYLNREGVDLGRATTLTLATLFLDELFFVIFCPIIMLVLPISDLFNYGTGSQSFMAGVETVFWTVYAGIVVYTAILFFGIIYRPRAVAQIIRRIFMLRILQRFRRRAFATADNMLHTSRELRNCSRGWWLNVFGATVVSWFSRYLVVNALFWGFVPEASGLLVFGRQFVVWVLLMVSPTPGGSGVSEWLFTEYYGDLMNNAGMALILAVAWRIVSYYIYLIVGSMLIPSYFKKRKIITIQQDETQ